MKKICDNNDALQMKHSKYESSYVWLASHRTIFLREDITKDLAAELSALLFYYDNKSTEEDIRIYFHCNGGDADGLINIYDVMQIIKAPVQTICLGKAYSAAAILLAAGTKGKRFAFKNSKIMIHGIQCLFPLSGFDSSLAKNYFDFLNILDFRATFSYFLTFSKLPIRA